MRRELKDGVLGGVQDERARAQMLGAELLDRGDPVAGAIADDLTAHRVLKTGDDVRRKPVRVGRQRLIEHHAHQLPVPRRGVLARSEAVQAAVDHGVCCRRDAA